MRVEPNENLMDSRNLSEASRECLRNVYSRMSGVLSRPDMYDDPVEEVEALEYVMQYLWGFPLDKNLHSYWFQMEGCTCPEMDNEDVVGTPYRVYNGSCKWHGGKSVCTH